ncbi:hypothetical protein Acsp04_54860 [Actinomadura sp. NBRC 104425]|uniref:hypothetical protein n=1 Tax=Actinomadura sp. NBRC 104425 TaxID=3032204 RepID=UPI00249FB67A|nr:hypothetical protein [Actinomadura sp. NBRC 104425]GLZ15251.1 hypothetical protein Acsp04_54860 [Actinomadura sp. NBRC 104425]
MSRHAFVFVGGADVTLDDLVALGERVLEGSFVPDGDGTLLLVMRGGAVAVNLSRHIFTDDPEDDDDFPSYEAHPYWFEVRDLDKNYGRQMEIARDIFHAVVDEGRWRAFLSDDLQTLEAVYTPADGLIDYA